MTKNTHSPTPGEAFRSDLHERLPKRSARAGIIDQKIDGAELLANALESCRYLDRTAGINSVAPGYHTKPIVLTASVDWQSTRHSHRQLIKGDAQECGKESTGSVRRDGQRVQVRGPSQILNRGVFDHDPPSRSSTHSDSDLTAISQTAVGALDWTRYGDPSAAITRSLSSISSWRSTRAARARWSKSLDEPGANARLLRGPSQE